MASFDTELLDVALSLVTRAPGQRGKLSQAKVRRSISTSYYALFHFLLNDLTYKVAGSGATLSKQRRILARTITHSGLTTTLNKIAGAAIDTSVQDFLGAPNHVAPRFARNLAKAFVDAQSKRHDADYNMNKALTALDARLLHSRVKDVIEKWRTANSQDEKAFKHALSILILLKGQLRTEN